MNPRKISKDVRVLVVLVLLGIAFKAFLLWQRANYIDPDEGYYLILARNLVSGSGYTLNGLPNIIFPPLLPFLIALFYFVVHNLQMSLGLVTAVSGGLLGFVIYKICRLKVSPGYSALGAFLVLFIFQLNAFIPINRPYIYVLYRGSDILNTLLLCSVLFLVIRLIQTKKIIYSVGAGVLSSLAYLTRPEGFLLWSIVVALLIFLSVVKMARIPLKLILGLILTFVCCSSPYAVYLRNTTGHWMLSGKIAAGQEYRKALLNVITNDDWEPFNGVHYSINSDLLEMNDQYFGYHSTGRSSESGTMLSSRTVLENLSLSAVVPKVLFPYPLFIFFIIGLIDGVTQVIKKKSATDAILFSAFLYSLALIAVAYPIPRHHLFLVPVFCIYSLLGIRTLRSFLMKELSRTISTMIVFSVVFFSFASDYIRYFDDSVITSKNFKIARQIDRDISEYLRTRGCRVLMSIQPGFAVWAFSDWQVLPRADLTTLLKFASKKRVDYIVLQESGGYHYRIIEMNGSVIPDSRADKMGFQLIDMRDNFALVRVVKQTGIDK